MITWSDGSPRHRIYVSTKAFLDGMVSEANGLTVDFQPTYQLIGSQKMGVNFGQFVAL